MVMDTRLSVSLVLQHNLSHTSILQAHSLAEEEEDESDEDGDDEKEPGGAVFPKEELSRTPTTCRSSDRLNGLLSPAKENRNKRPARLDKVSSLGDTRGSQSGKSSEGATASRISALKAKLEADKAKKEQRWVFSAGQVELVLVSEGKASYRLAAFTDMSTL